MTDEGQRRILLDTSVYGRLVADEATLHDLQKAQESHQLIIYGTRIIRQELRNTPKSAMMAEGRKLRIILINVYDSLIKKQHHDLDYNKLIDVLSCDYFDAYKQEGGSLSNHEMRNDLIIVATATIYHLDIVVSDDERSMFSDKAIRAYKRVNKEYGMSNPAFKTYANFKRELSRRSFQYGI